MFAVSASYEVYSLKNILSVTDQRISPISLIMDEHHECVLDASKRLLAQVVDFSTKISQQDKTVLFARLFKENVRTIRYNLETCRDELEAVKHHPKDLAFPDVDLGNIKNPTIIEFVLGGSKLQDFEDIIDSLDSELITLELNEQNITRVENYNKMKQKMCSCTLYTVGIAVFCAASAMLVNTFTTNNF